MHPVSRSIEIKPRNVHFHIREADHDRPYHWHGGNAAKSIIFNAMSIMFPEGEQFVIDSVKSVRTEVSDPVLRSQIDGLIAQEATHGREHKCYNTGLDSQGYRASELSRLLHEQRVQLFAQCDIGRRLAVTAAIEHLTAVLAGLALSDDVFLSGAEDEYARMWFWHCIEEVEHKGVAYDAFAYFAQRDGYFCRGYFRRCRAMLFASGQFFRSLTRHMLWMMQDAGLSGSWRDWLDVFNFMFGRPGLLRRSFLSWCRWFAPGFHPWNKDDRAAMEKRILSSA